MIEIHLYGRLRRLTSDPRGDREAVVHLDAQRGETASSVLERLGVRTEEIAHIFLNGALLLTRNSMAPWLRYPRPVDRGEGLDAPLCPGDRLGLFGRDMAMLVV